MGIPLGRPVSPGCHCQEHEGGCAHNGRPDRFQGPFLHRRIVKPHPGPVGADVDRAGDESELGSGEIEYFRRFVGYVASRAALIPVADILIHLRVGEHGGPGNADPSLVRFDRSR